MKANNSYKQTGHSRTIHITGIDPEAPLQDLFITINYVIGTNEGGAIEKAVTLDKYVIPAIVDLINFES